MSQDAWINSVRQEVETSPAFLAAHEAVSAWQNRKGLIDFFATMPPEVYAAKLQLEEMSDGRRIAYEAGRRYQQALQEWRYRQG